MSVVIIGGNECMERQYKDLCQEYRCRAKVFTKMNGGLKNKIGNPDLLVLFTSTMSHKMLHSALSETKGQGTIIRPVPLQLHGGLKKHPGDPRGVRRLLCRKNWWSASAPLPWPD